MFQPIHIEVLDRILRSIHPSGDRLLCSFIFGKPGAPVWDRRMGSEIFVNRKNYIRALLYLRQNGAPYLRDISISALWSMVTDFIIENFWHIGNNMFIQQDNCSYAEQISTINMNALADALAQSVMFEPGYELTLYPLLPIRLETNFEADNFFLINASDLSLAHIPSGSGTNFLAPDKFPPIAHWDGKKSTTISWLGIRSPLALISKKIASAILGAVALTPLPRLRYLFSERAMFGGQCTFNDANHTFSINFSPHTPAMMHDIVLTKDDHIWLKRLAALLETNDNLSRSRLRALEYFYRAWFLDPRERFPVLCMSLDSLVAVSHRHTAEAVKFIQNAINLKIDDDRLRLLMRVRGAVVHGASPDVYDSENYARYYEDYETDPIYDLELVVAKCLRAEIFSGTLRYHNDPDTKIIENIKAKGHSPKIKDDDFIISENI